MIKRLSIAEWAVSPTPRDARRDRIEKVDDYAAFGIRHSWLVDPERRSLEILALAAGQYRTAFTAAGGTLTDLPGCGGFTFDLDALWAEVDRLGPEEPV
jgi:Uma2 family endonuclease